MVIIGIWIIQIGIIYIDHLEQVKINNLTNLPLNKYKIMQKYRKVINMNRKRIFIAILIVFAIILIIILLLYKFKIDNKNNKNEIELTNNYEYNKEEIEPAVGSSLYQGDNTLKDIENHYDYFTIKDIVINYYCQCKNLLNPDITLPQIDVISGDESKKYIDDQKKELQKISENTLLNILGKEYIKEFNINNNNMKRKFGIDYLYEILFSNIKISYEFDDMSAFYVEGFIINEEKNKINPFKFIIVVDSSNSSYSIYPQEYLEKHNYNNLKKGDKLSLGIKEIENNLFNEIGDVDDSEETICGEYFENIKLMILYMPEKVYNLLDKEYKNKRFSDIDNFKQYLKYNKDILSKMQIKEYRVTSLSNYTDYICVDNYNNYYKFRVKNGLLDYTVFLDNYTIMSNNEIAAYSQLSDLSKAQYNLNKFIKMVNTKNYSAIYNHLNAKFKNNNFNNINNLEKYIKNRFYELNDIEIQNYDDKNYKYIVFECKLINQIDNNQSKNLSVIIKLKEGTDFEMSFSIQ